jgi:cell division septum initiation protein DivIVA
MGAVQRHSFEVVRKGYEPEAVDDVILRLTIAKNDAEALAAKLQKQVDAGGPSPAQASTEAARIVADAKTQARQIVDEAARRAESTLGGARAEAHRVLTEARNTALAGANGTPSPASIHSLLALAERFETQITALAKSALADTATLTAELHQALTATATQQTPARSEPPAPRRHSAARPAVPEDEGESTLDLLRKRAAKNASANGSTAPGNAAPDANARPASRTARDAAAHTTTFPDTEPDTSTSLSSRIKREQGSAASEERQRDNGRGSYYSKRSARLPRIGEEATAGAMAAVRSVRKGGEGAATDIDEPAEQTA